MLIFDILRSALRSLAANRLRTVLTMLGVVIGVGSVVGMISLGEGAKSSVERSIKSLGTDLLFIRPGPPRRGHVRVGSVETLSLGDAEALLKIPGVILALPEVARNAQAKYLSVNANVSIVGTVPEFFEARTFEFAEGAGFSEQDDRAGRKVAVIGSETARTLFAGDDPIGARIQIKGASFTVIGTLKAKGESGWSNPDEQIVIPMSVAQKALFGLDHITNLTLKIDPEYPQEVLQEDIKRTLRLRHRLAADAEDDFNIRAQSEMVERMSEVTGTFTALLGGVAAVSLLVGGIGIMNIMLVSVRERTKEIGIRKAVGAKRSDILLQFLIEAVIVSIMGGVIGIGLGYSIAWLIAELAEWETIVPMYAVLLALATSIGIGVVFGVWPAREAARLDPVEALRYE